MSASARATSARRARLDQHDHARVDGVGDQVARAAERAGQLARREPRQPARALLVVARVLDRERGQRAAEQRRRGARRTRAPRAARRARRRRAPGRRAPRRPRSRASRARTARARAPRRSGPPRRPRARARTASGSASSSRAVALIVRWSSVKSKFMPASSARSRQAEHALGDDVLEDLGRAALDRVAARAQQLVAPGRAGDERVRRRAARPRAGRAAGWCPTTSTSSASPPAPAGRTSRSRSGRGRRSGAGSRPCTCSAPSLSATTSSSSSPRSAASSIRSSSSWRSRTWRKNASPARSFISVVSATFQPLPTPPIT